MGEMEVNVAVNSEIETLENELHTLKKLRSELLRMRDMLTYFRRDLDGITVNQHSLADINSTWSALAAMAARISPNCD